MSYLNSEKIKFQFWKLYFEIGDSVIDNLDVAKYFYEQIFHEPPTNSHLIKFMKDVDNLLYECKTDKDDVGKKLTVFYIPNKRTCRFCGNKLISSNKTESTFFDEIHGIRRGWRFRMVCSKCNISEYGTFFSKGKYRILDVEAEDDKWFVSTEETIICTSLLKKYQCELLYANLAFLCKSQIFNELFGINEEEEAQSKTSNKRLKMNRPTLDRRRLEDAFLLYAVKNVCRSYSIKCDQTITDRNTLLKSINEDFYKKFVEKWSGHQCEKQGCGRVLVLDGNMKTSRRVCAVKDITSVVFPTMKEEFKTGCLNTPIQDSKFCSLHESNSMAKDHEDETELTIDKNHETRVSEETEENVDEGELDSINDNLKIDQETTGDYSVLQICAIKETRNSKLYQILWHTGEKTWVRDEKIPEHIKNQGTFLVEQVTDTNLGCDQNVAVIKPTSTINCAKQNSTTAKKKRCQTEKTKHSARDKKTSGVLVFTSPCGVVVNMKELYISESKLMYRI
uniref:Uncharacterized protein n=1 Tax=Clytia hemisphaerica TaxID=252671 RepID=A0A7M5TT31_9CNID